MDQDVLNRMHQRTTPALMRLRRSIVENPFAMLKYSLLEHPCFLLRGLRGAHTEISFAAMANNLKRMINILGGLKLATKLSQA